MPDAPSSAPVAADTSTATTPPAGTAAAPVATPGAQTTAEELIEILLDGEKEPRKIPLSKLQPHLAKHRSETDRLRSEYDKNAKALGERQSKLEAVLRAAKEDPDGTLRELGLDPDEYAERKLAARVRAALQAEEEKADPTKKESREADEERKALKDENEKLKKAQVERERATTKGRIEGAVNAVLSKLPEGLRADSKAAVLSVFRQALAEKKDITIEDAAKATLSLIRARAKAAYEADEELRKGLGAPPSAPKPAAGATVIEHPAARGAAARAKDGTFVKPPENDGAGDVLSKIMRGQFK